MIKFELYKTEKRCRNELTKSMFLRSVSEINERLLIDEIDKWITSRNESTLLADMIDAMALSERSKQDNWDNFIKDPGTGVCLLCKSVAKNVIQQYHRGVSAG